MLITHLAGTLALKSLTTLAAFQAQDAGTSGNLKYLTIFVGITAFALLLQSLVVLVIGIGAMKAQKGITDEVTELKGKLIPLIEKSHALVTDLTPEVREITTRISTITAHVEAISAMAKQKADEFAPTISAANQTVQDANETVRVANLKTRAQIGRVDGMVTSALDATARIGVALEQSIRKPGREIAGVLSGLKAGLDQLMNRSRPFGSSARPSTSASPTAPATYRPRDKSEIDL